MKRRELLAYVNKNYEMYASLDEGSDEAGLDVRDQPFSPAYSNWYIALMCIWFALFLKGVSYLAIEGQVSTYVLAAGTFAVVVGVCYYIFAPYVKDHFKWRRLHRRARALIDLTRQQLQERGQAFIMDVTDEPSGTVMNLHFRDSSGQLSRVKIDDRQDILKIDVSFSDARLPEHVV
ncbi:hypothetical protein [Pseudomonas baetica]|uniref:hypothetical protein n=1 Tax=Pseudomonas baetica TaxID=674054 RepID=UPI0024049B90|nr:hypothetical protein [Pseudomonas baetica]MDF9779112.1 hypothetical protein [Pseudomonas baetica]